MQSLSYGTRHVYDWPYFPWPITTEHQEEKRLRLLEPQFDVEECESESLTACILLKKYWVLLQQLSSSSSFLGHHRKLRGCLSTSVVSINCFLACLALPYFMASCPKFFFLSLRVSLPVLNSSVGAALGIYCLGDRNYPAFPGQSLVRGRQQIVFDQQKRADD